MPPSERSLARRKRKDDIIIEEEKATTSSQGDLANTKSLVETPSVSSLSPKPCYTCGREISPRAKWARNWDTIKYCSDHCKGWKSTVRVCSIESGSDEVISNLPQDSHILKSCLVVRDDFLLLHLDAWIETTIHKLISSKGNGMGAPPIALQQVSDHMNAEVNIEPISPFYLIIKDRILLQNPGQREMIRRAARRLMILDQKDWSSTVIFGQSNIQIQLSQDKGKQILRTLQDVSFAKGKMYIKRVHM